MPDSSLRRTVILLERESAGWYQNRLFDSKLVQPKSIRQRPAFSPDLASRIAALMLANESM